MRTLVTGSTGFVGANLVERLAAAGHAVRALHRPNSRLEALAGLDFEPAVGDVLDPSSLAVAMKGVDWVFHVAAVSDYWRRGRKAQLYQVNVTGTRHVLETAMSADVQRVVFTSSAASLGLPRGCLSQSGLLPHFSPWRRSENGRQMDHLLDESATFNVPPTLLPYGHSKHLAEQVVHEFVARGLDAVIVNPTAVLGPRDLNLISGSIVLAVYRRQVPVIPPGGVNYIDVSDVVAGHIAAAKRGKPGERYILGAHNLSHRQAVKTIAQIVDVPSPRVQLPGALTGPLALAVELFNRIWPGERLTDSNQVRLMRHSIFYDVSKAQQELGLESPIPFAVSVERTFQWYRENGYL